MYLHIVDTQLIGCSWITEQLVIGSVQLNLIIVYSIIIYSIIIKFIIINWQNIVGSFYDVPDYNLAVIIIIIILKSDGLSKLTSIIITLSQADSDYQLMIN